MRPGNKTRAERHVPAATEGEVVLAASDTLADGLYRVVIAPAEASPVRRELTIESFVASTEQPVGTLAVRRREALEHAAGQRGDIFADIARVALGRLGLPRPRHRPGDD